MPNSNRKCAALPELAPAKYRQLSAKFSRHHAYFRNVATSSWRCVKVVMRGSAYHRYQVERFLLGFYQTARVALRQHYAGVWAQGKSEHPLGFPDDVGLHPLRKTSARKKKYEQT
jgi:hypothetical protein